MKRLITRMFAKGFLRTARQLGKLGFRKGGRLVRSKGFKDALKIVGISATSTVVGGTILKMFTDDEINNASRGVSLELPNGDMVLSRQHFNDKFRQLRDDVDGLSYREDGPDFGLMAKRNRLIINLVDILGDAYSAEESHRMLTFLNDVLQAKLAGASIQEAPDSDLLVRYSITLSENELDNESAQYRLTRTAELLSSGLPLM